MKFEKLNTLTVLTQFKNYGMKLFVIHSGNKHLMSTCYK